MNLDVCTYNTFFSVIRAFLSFLSSFSKKESSSFVITSLIFSAVSSARLFSEEKKVNYHSKSDLKLSSNIQNNASMNQRYRECFCLG